MNREINVEFVGNDVIKAFNKYVVKGSGCIPVISDSNFETHLLFTYCHKVCNDNFNQDMFLNVFLADNSSAFLLKTKFSNNQSQYFALKDILKNKEFKGACFAWTEPNGDPKGFLIGNTRLAPIFWSVYKDSNNNNSFVHSSAAYANYHHERAFIVPEENTSVTAIVCAPVDAYANKLKTLYYEIGLKKDKSEWKYIKKEFDFAPSIWLDLGELFNEKFEPDSNYTYSIKGPKGKGWIMLKNTDCLSIHHI